MLLFAAILFWINSSLTDSFQSLADGRQRKTAVAAMGSAPSGDDAIEAWLKRISSQNDEFDLIFLRGFPEDEGGMRAFAGTPELEELLGSYEGTRSFAKGLESSMYDEVFQPSDRLTVRGETRRVLSWIF